MSDLAAFRNDVRHWLERHCPDELRGTAASFEGGMKEPPSEAQRRWFDAALERGWTVPAWPRAYGGAGLDADQHRALRVEMAAYGAPAPLTGMGVSMIGPTLLEFGTDAQKGEHLRNIAHGKVRWCQGYSEPGAGSDLASLKTRAELHGDSYRINGSKIWTSFADKADWIFCLVRTDPSAPKHDGISFVLFAMDQPGVTVKPIHLIAGNSDFCQCFFDDVTALKANLIGQENRGWTVAKRLLQHERAMISGPGGGIRTRGSLTELAKCYTGERDGRIADTATRDEVAAIEMDARAFALTLRRATEENSAGRTETFVTSMFKYYSTELDARRAEANVRFMGTRGVGWEGGEFTPHELSTTRTWLFGKALTIAGGSSEVQLNIVAKRVLGLPD
ncbi:MAG TPA: acyl-CoA dehydrogenase family protein [Pseudomonadales bacterium]